MKPKRVSLRAHINAMCKHCIYDPEGNAGTWTQQVEACTCTKCPLYPVRPNSRAKRGHKAHTDEHNTHNEELKEEVYLLGK